MILRELNLIGFGKYENKTIKLEDGINIVYGENESGKTTIHSFIDGMFYGFLRPYVRSTLYQEEHKKYEPWRAERYAGVIQFYHEGELYRIEREFTRGKEETKVLVENTAENITQNIDTGSKGRVLQPGFHFFGFNNSVFANTISIKQLSSRTDDSLADEVRDKLVNVTTTLDDEISIEKAIKELNTSLKDIGTIKAHTSVYGTTFAKITSLEEEIKEILIAKDEYVNLLDKDSNIKSAITKLNNNLESERLELKKAEYNSRRNIYQEALEITRDLKDKEIELGELAPYKDLSSDDYSGAISLVTNIGILESKIDDSCGQIDELDIQLNILKNKVSFEKDKELDEISIDYLNFYKMDEDKNKLIYGQDSSSLEFLSRDFDKNNGIKLRFNILLIISIISYVFLNYFFRSSWTLVLLTQLIILPIILIFIMIKSQKRLLSRINNQIIEIKQAGEDRRKRVMDIENNQKNILDKYNVNSRVDFRALYDNINHKKLKREEELQSVNDIQVKINLAKAKIASLEKQKTEQMEKLEIILSDNLALNIEEFGKGLKKKDLYDDILVDIENKKGLLKRILVDCTLFDLKNYIEENSYLESSEIVQIDTVKKNIENLQTRLSQLLIEEKGLEERINLMTPKVSKLVDKEEELYRAKVLMEKLDRKREAIELSKSTIENLSKEIHNQFAPEINKRVGNIIDRITGGKYSEVRINNNLDIGVIDNYSGEMVNINSLSGGTIDQLYFSLRFGVVNSMIDNNLPLILDDCFIQYDDIRLGNILKLLVDISKDRQVVLFSCQNRERELLENMDVDFNLITLI